MSQFSALEGKKVLSDVFKLPKDVYPVGRLDLDSEGLLIISNDKQLNYRLLNPVHQHERTYIAQVEGLVNEEALQTLRAGVTVSIDGKAYQTLPCKAEVYYEPANLPERNPPIRFRASIPTSWIKITLTEGKNHQVRKMTASVGFPTLRLIRTAIVNLQIGTMKPGDIVTMDKVELYKKLALMKVK
jgi:23S rRNA pseudouridine2457 synthase